MTGPGKGNPHPIPHPNPNLPFEIKTGPTSEIGKLKVSLNAVKPYSLSKQMQLGRSPESKNRETLLSQLISESKTKETRALIKMLMKDRKFNEIKRYNLLVLWLKSQTKKELKVLVELENLYSLLEPSVTTQILDKFIRNEPISKSDIEKAKFLRDTLATIQELKFGKKHVQVNTSFKDIRDFMGFEKKEEKWENATDAENAAFTQ